MEEEEYKLIAIDIKEPADTPIESTGTAYYRLPDHLFEFFKKCEEKHDIIGFDWQRDRNFGLILRDKKEENK